MHSFIRIAFSVLCVFTLIPGALGAGLVEDALSTNANATVSRGDFVRAAVKLLDVPRKPNVAVPSTRPIPSSLLPYMQAAHEEGALIPFGESLHLAHPITIGEALQVLFLLTDLAPRGEDADFRDVQNGSLEETAVQVAIEQMWMKPLRSNIFGVERLLTGDGARELLRNVTGQEETAPARNRDIPTVEVEIQLPPRRPQTNTSESLPGENILKGIWNLLQRNYLYEDKIDERGAAEGAAEALVESLKDPYSTYLPPEDAFQFQSQIDGEVTGIGAQVDFKNEIVTVIAPLPGSPALEAGLKPGDQILAVDEQSLRGMTFNEAVRHIRGPVGTTITLTIVRDGREMKVDVTRDKISVPEIEIDFEGDVAVVRLVQFGTRTDTMLRRELEKVQRMGPKGLVLDLRSNPGGLLHAAEVTLSNFLPEGSTIAHIVSRNDEDEQVTRDEPTIADNIPMVVLINGGSASASEIVAGALQDANRATVVGEKSFGKGTVQQIIEFIDGSSLKMTIAEWLTPARRKIDGVGVDPDIEVKQTDVGDEQMRRALELLRR